MSIAASSASAANASKPPMTPPMVGPNLELPVPPNSSAGATVSAVVLLARLLAPAGTGRGAGTGTGVRGETGRGAGAGGGVRAVGEAPGADHNVTPTNVSTFCIPSIRYGKPSSRGQCRCGLHSVNREGVVAQLQPHTAARFEAIDLWCKTARAAYKSSSCLTQDCVGHRLVSACQMILQVLQLFLVTDSQQACKHRRNANAQTKYRTCLSATNSALVELSLRVISSGAKLSPRMSPLYTDPV